MEKFQNRAYGYFYSYEFFFERFLEPFVKKGIVLDAGCGNGRLLSKLETKKLSNVVLVGLDKNRKMLKQAWLNTRKAHLVIADLYSLPFKRKIFDLIICNDVLEHLEDPQESLQEFSNILTTGGILVISTQNLLYPIYLIRYLVPKNILKPLEESFGIRPLEIYFKMNLPWKLKNVLVSHGFGLVDFEFFLLDDLFQLPIVYSLFLFLFDQGLRLLNNQRSRGGMVCVARLTACSSNASTKSGGHKRVRYSLKAP